MLKLLQNNRYLLFVCVVMMGIWIVDDIRSIWRASSQSLDARLMEQIVRAEAMTDDGEAWQATEIHRPWPTIISSLAYLNWAMNAPGLIGDLLVKVLMGGLFASLGTIGVFYKRDGNFTPSINRTFFVIKALLIGVYTTTMIAWAWTMVLRWDTAEIDGTAIADSLEYTVKALFGQPLTGDPKFILMFFIVLTPLLAHVGRMIEDEEALV